MLLASIERRDLLLAAGERADVWGVAVVDVVGIVKCVEGGARQRACCRRRGGGEGKREMAVRQARVKVWSL